MSKNKVLAQNRKARYDYEILETFEAGLVLTGNEIKSIRMGKISLQEAYARPYDNELWLMGAHIAFYTSGASSDYNPTRARKLLLHKEEITHLSKAVDVRGLTLVPTRIYLRRHLAKVEIGLAKGRKQYDKRRALVDKYREREALEAMSKRSF